MSQGIKKINQKGSCQVPVGSLRPLRAEARQLLGKDEKCVGLGDQGTEEEDPGVEVK